MLPVSSLRNHPFREGSRAASFVPFGSCEQQGRTAISPGDFHQVVRSTPRVATWLFSYREEIIGVALSACREKIIGPVIAHLVRFAPKGDRAVPFFPFGSKGPAGKGHRNHPREEAIMVVPITWFHVIFFLFRQGVDRRCLHGGRAMMVEFTPRGRVHASFLREVRSMPAVMPGSIVPVSTCACTELLLDSREGARAQRLATKEIPGS
jgi:hypothetical protein